MKRNLPRKYFFERASGCAPPRFHPFFIERV